MREYEEGFRCQPWANLSYRWCYSQPRNTISCLPTSFPAVPGRRTGLTVTWKLYVGDVIEMRVECEPALGGCDMERQRHYNTYVIVVSQKKKPINLGRSELPNAITGLVRLVVQKYLISRRVFPLLSSLYPISLSANCTQLNISLLCYFLFTACRQQYLNLDTVLWCVFLALYFQNTRLIIFCQSYCPAVSTRGTGHHCDDNKYSYNHWAALVPWSRVDDSRDASSRSILGSVELVGTISPRSYSLRTGCLWFIQTISLFLRPVHSNASYVAASISTPTCCAP